MDTSPEEETKQGKREKRKRKQKEKMTQHGKGIAKIYEDAVRKRVKEDEQDDKSD
ncbi:hypothetical protein ACFLVR_04080 [Chloroflexota bacterium]